MYMFTVHTNTKNIHHILVLFLFISHDPSLQVRACNLLGGYVALESLSHLVTSDLSREAIKKHQDTVLEQLKVSSVTVTIHVHKVV